MCEMPRVRVTSECKIFTIVNKLVNKLAAPLL